MWTCSTVRRNCRHLRRRRQNSHWRCSPDRRRRRRRCSMVRWTPNLRRPWRPEATMRSCGDSRWRPHWDSRRWRAFARLAWQWSGEIVQAVEQWSLCWWRLSRTCKLAACSTRRPVDKTAEVLATDCRLPRVLGFGVIAVAVVAVVVGGGGGEQLLKRDVVDGKTLDLNVRTKLKIIILAYQLFFKEMHHDV